MSRDPRVDAYIAKAAPFAQPLLAQVREQVHAALPGIEEAIKWSRPAFLLDGKILLVMAAFKAHMALAFWRGSEIVAHTSDEAMGQFGRITGPADLPSAAELKRLLEEAAAVSRAAPKKAAKAPRPTAELHPDFTAALDRVPAAKATFDGFPPSCRREYAEWVAEAKREETRAKRIATAIAQLAEGKKLHWKYESC
jgi:uncharacterized protein YdeI (YjbR/CyaY-like superfamily)